MPLKTKMIAAAGYGFILAALIVSCNNAADKKNARIESDSLTEEQKHLPENALKTLTVADGLEVTAIATEPMLQNPTNIDVDDRGRIWVCEAYNYRPGINGNPTNALGDRIVILEDKDGDSKTDTAKVFYQGPELNAPLGICVLGNKAIVSQSPFVWIFYDDNGDDKADRKEILFQGISGEQHDHGVHAFTFGPDGKLYFNFGNAGKQLKDKNGRPVRDQDGDIIDNKKYKEGMVFRCNPDGSAVECLAHNFRNPYEVAVDSYGSLWQSDNDDDGNRGTRINYILQYGNYGYTDEMTGAGWQANRTNIEDSIPLRHWYQNDPGSVPNVLQTFAGSPTGMIIYEGSLLPQPFQGSMIHCDAGPNVVRSYPVKKNGAGYTAGIVNILKDDKNQWFRPADVCVAPDGSLIVADWYDPGVGGHAAADQARGRIYRVAPRNSKYSIPAQDYTTTDGAAKALQNPNLAVRYHAFTALQKMGTTAIPALEKIWRTSEDPRMRARAFWVLAKMPAATAEKYISEAVADHNADLRITGLRAARELNKNLIATIKQLINDPDAQVRRECAISLHHNKSEEAAELWSSLALQYDGKDRWYLEALGIGADQQWDKFFTTYLTQVKDKQTAAFNDLVWRARTDKAVPYLAALASDNNIPLGNRLRYFRAFDFNTGPAKSALLLKMIQENSGNDVALNKLVLRHLDVKTVKQNPAAQKTLREVLQSLAGTNEYVEMVARYEVKTENSNLLQLAINNYDKSLGKDAASLMLKLGGSQLVWNIINAADSVQQKKLLASLAGVGSKVSVDMLQTIALSNKYAMPLRKESAGLIGKSWSGEERVLEILKAKKVPKELIPAVVSSVSGAWRGAIRNEAASYLPNEGKTTAAKKAITMQEINALTANAEDGKKVFTTACATCHRVNESGYDFGPALHEIGSKLPKESLLESIVSPSAGIGFGYEGWELRMKDGSTMSGIIASKTETDIDLKFPGGGKKAVKTADLKTLTQMKESMMPEGLQNNLSAQELANLLEYLTGLKKK
ncbi:PVC-type heme-binding CxxCH protein [Terrimonas pollutisoli]|uniref:PVC-type heme-binding CxxCH protein n=1 Tax=Terrimonas pollutisoli TaxID=3034147 RepID=UPI0023ED3542|nr:PVC-type heme-binding CxxCH protein [Terrimonas sp. H1YJ31]